MELTPKYKQIKVYCTSGTITRDDLITEWCIVQLESGKEIEAYYHYHEGWMTRGAPEGRYKYGYVPVKEKVINWKYK